MLRSLRHAFPQVTGKKRSILPTELEAIDRACRHSMDTFIGREAGPLAVHSGMRQQQISRQREIVEDAIPALAKVGRIVAAGQVIGRTFEDVAALLMPVTDLAAGSLAPWLPIIGSEDLVESVDRVAANSLRAHGEAIVALIQSCDDGKRTDAERAEIRAKLRDLLKATFVMVEFNETAGRG